VADLVVWTGEEDLAALAGPKMARLGELSRAGLVVPRSFVVTTEAYARHMSASGLGARVDDMLGGLGDRPDHVALRDLAERIRDAFGAVAVYEPVAAAIAAGYDELSARGLIPDVPVAVRSSAPGEDSGEVSFAGVFDSFLGVKGAERVIDAVRSCWASLYSARALAYGFEPGARMAVGVAELVDARSSGVAFSLHPLTGRRDRVVIEANWGWGGSVVQGQVIPDHVEVAKDDHRVLRHDVATKLVVSALDSSAGCVVETRMPPRLRDRAVLGADEIEQIVAAVLTIERYYGYPVDVEWVVGRGRRRGQPPSIVQARPVTAAPDPGPVPGWDPVGYAFGDQARGGGRGR
jgi:pyruvate, water dikinase